MKKIYLSIVTVFFAINFSHAQWTQYGSTGNYYLSTNGYVLFGNGNSGFIGNDPNGAIEIGPVSSSAATPYMDWHYGTGSSQDYNVRLMNSGDGRFDIITVSNGAVFTVNGNTVGINTANTRGYTFAVNGSAIATSVTVKSYGSWPDYVFKPSYCLPTLAEVSAYTTTNQHLPDMPSEEEVAAKGIDLGEMNKLLTKKVEEMTLYLIESDKKQKQQEDRINRLEVQLLSLSKKIN